MGWLQVLFGAGPKTFDQDLRLVAERWKDRGTPVAEIIEALGSYAALLAAEDERRRLSRSGAELAVEIYNRHTDIKA